jgi:hypothetical protein
MFGFSVTFLSMDGAQSNRDFMNILLVHTGSGTFTIDNIYDPKRSKISIIMDFIHFSCGTLVCSCVLIPL